MGFLERQTILAALKYKGYLPSAIHLLNVKQSLDARVLMSACFKSLAERPSRPVALRPVRFMAYSTCSIVSEKGCVLAVGRGSTVQLSPFETVFSSGLLVKSQMEDQL